MENNNDLVLENEQLKQRIIELENELEKTREHLKKYTSGKNNKNYYEKHKEQIMEDGRKYLNKLKEENPEKIKEYRRRAYLKRKEKLQKEKEQNVY